MTLDQIIACVRGTEEFKALTTSLKAALRAGDHSLLSGCLDQRIASLETIDATRADSVRAVLIALNNL